MKQIRFFLFLFFLSSLLSCLEHQNVSNEINLKGQTVKFDSQNEGIWPFSKVGDYLYACSKDKVFSGKLSATSWQKVEPIFDLGHGHTEFGRVILSRDNNGALFVLNRPLNGNYLLSLTKIPQTDSTCGIKDKAKWEIFDFREMHNISVEGQNFVIISDSTILVTGAPIDDMKHVFSIIDFKNQTTTPLDYWPDDSSPSDHVYQKLSRYTQDCGLLSNGKNRYLYWNSWGMLAFIFTIDGKNVKIISQQYSDPFPYKDKPTTERVACCVDSEYIYMLLRDSDSKGGKFKQYKSPFIFGNTVEIYNWDGVKQQVIHLDDYGQKIMLSEDGKTLYLFNDYSDYESDLKITSYDLISVK